MGRRNSRGTSSSEPLINPIDSNGIPPNMPEPTLRTTIIHACLTVNSTTLYTYDDRSLNKYYNVRMSYAIFPEEDAFSGRALLP